MTNAIYNSLANHILNNSPVQWVDLYGAQGDQTEQEYPITYPAVFLECVIQETTSNKEFQEVEALLIVHLLVEDYRDSHHYRKSSLSGVEGSGIEDPVLSGAEAYNPLTIKHNLFTCLQFHSEANLYKKLIRTGERMRSDYDAITEFEIEFSFTYFESYEPETEDGISGTLRLPKPPPQFDKEITTP